ncbi:MAG TPA: copper homeostasis periplasmic binding protein CopC [Paenirhodobacter sp.]
MKPFKTLLISGCIATFAFAGQAMAHAHLSASVPAAEATVDSPKLIEMTFTEPLELKLSTAMVMSSAGAHIATAAPVLGGDGMTLIVPLTGPLAAGTYGVMWQVLSVDGHKTSGNYSFSVK